MVFPDFKDFPRSGRVLGIDWGARRIGVAISDETWVFFWSRPQIDIKIVTRSPAEVVAQIAKDEKVTGIIIGLPLYSDGTESDTATAVRHWATELTAYTDLPIIFIAENLTSVAATENLVGMRRGKVKEKLDSESACVILENGLAMIKRDAGA